jgi:hypothetical protein
MIMESVLDLGRFFVGTIGKGREAKGEGDKGEETTRDTDAEHGAHLEVANIA